MPDRIADRFAIIDLMNRYAFALDDRAFERLRDVFTPDAQFSEFTPEPKLGIEVIVASCTRTLTRFKATQHLLGPAGIEWRGDDAAGSRTPILATHEYPVERGGGIYTLAAVYHDDLVRTAEGWRISHRRLRTSWQQTVGRAPRPE